MESQQIMEFLLKMEADRKADRKSDIEEIKTTQAKADANRVQMLERMEADRKADQERMEADRKADQERMEADQRDLKERMKMMQAYQAKTKAVLPAIQVTETSRKETAAAF
jgi:hypothetical protein